MASQVDICNLALRRLGEREITLITDSNKRAEHCNAFWTYVLDEVLEDYAWNFAKKVATLDYTTGFGVYTSDDEKTITNITQAAPPVVSATAHGFSDGHLVYIYDVSGMTEVNQRIYKVTASSTNAFSLLDMDGTPWTAYTSGGKTYRMEVDSRYSNGYAYDLPADYLQALHLDDEASEFEIYGTGNNERLVTTVKDAVLHYTSLESTTTNMTNRFISALAWRLAAELAVPLAKKGTTQEWAMGMYAYVLGKKSTADAREERQNLPDKDPWIQAGNFSV